MIKTIKTLNYISDIKVQGVISLKSFSFLKSTSNNANAGCQKNFNVELIVTGMHLLKTFGSTINEIYKKLSNIKIIPLYKQHKKSINEKVYFGKYTSAKLTNNI